MGCWGAYEQEKPTVGECAECGGPVDEDGRSTDVCKIIRGQADEIEKLREWQRAAMTHIQVRSPCTNVCVTNGTWNQKCLDCYLREKLIREVKGDD